LKAGIHPTGVQDYTAKMRDIFRKNLGGLLKDVFCVFHTGAFMSNKRWTLIEQGEEGLKPGWFVAQL